MQVWGYEGRGVEGRATSRAILHPAAYPFHPCNDGICAGLRMPQTQPSPDSTDATGQRPLLSFLFLVTLFSVVMDS